MTSVDSKLGKGGPFSDKKRAVVIKWLRAGHFRMTAAARARVSPVTITNWCARGAKEVEEAQRVAEEKGNDLDLESLGPHAIFYLDVAESEARAECKRVKQIAGSEDTADARWMLERRYPKRWGRAAMRVEHTGVEGGPVEVNVIDARKAFVKKLVASLEREGIALADPSSGPDDGPEGGPSGSS